MGQSHNGDSNAPEADHVKVEPNNVDNVQNVGKMDQKLDGDSYAPEPRPVKVEPKNVDNAQNVTTGSLSVLQSNESRKVMDIVDRLRRSGLSGELQLPQLVVTGDQSSGKSSVLEAITEIPFPRKENLCTRFATEIVLRRSSKASISTRITPDKKRPKEEKMRLQNFRSSIVDFSELPKLMEEATEIMGLNGGDGSVRAFSRDVLTIEIAGPGRPHLTLVDLPGLIHSENKLQTKEDVALIRSLVDDYIKQKRTIILAVVSAKNDYANQIILDKCREVDPKGHRTLGLVTKPDFLDAGSQNEATWIELVRNQDIYFDLGWHLLKNRSDKEVNITFDERNAREKAFFSTGSYHSLPPNMMGVEALRAKLSKLLFKHLKHELPDLQKELNEKLRKVVHELELLGEKRSTVQEQRRFLLSTASKYQEIVNTAVDGHYYDSFFGSLDVSEPVDHETNMLRLRAVVQFLNNQFSETMRDYGQKTIIVEAGSEESESMPPGTSSSMVQDEGYLRFADYQEKTTREMAIQRVSSIVVRSRGRELPGTFNPMLISQLFWDQSQKWKDIAEYHITRVADMCCMFVRKAMEATAALDIFERLYDSRVDKALEKRLENAKMSLAIIDGDNKRHPITYDPRFMETMREHHTNARKDAVWRLMEQSRGDIDRHRYPNGVDIYSLCWHLDHSSELDVEKASAEGALDASRAYYEDEVKYFIAVITKQVIERCLLTDLAADTLSPMVVGGMSDEEVAYIAAEPEEVTSERDSLETRKAALEKGQDAFRSALGIFVR